MREFCENPYCENPAVKEAPVSVESPADQVRSLCAVCEEAYTWGVQHGGMSAQLDHVDGFLLKGGFVVVGENRSDPCTGGPFEAWAYAGPLDFDSATPVVFGLGKDCRQALDALNTQLAAHEHGGTDTGCRSPDQPMS